MVILGVYGGRTFNIKYLTISMANLGSSLNIKIILVSFSTFRLWLSLWSITFPPFSSRFSSAFRFLRFFYGFSEIEIELTRCCSNNLLAVRIGKQHRSRRRNNPFFLSPRKKRSSPQQVCFSLTLQLCNIFCGERDVLIVHGHHTPRLPI